MSEGKADLRMTPRQVNHAIGVARSASEMNRPFRSVLGSSVADAVAWVKVLILVAAAFMLRPAAFGEEHTVVGLALGAVALSIYLLEILLRRKLRFTKTSVVVIFFGAILWSYLTVQAIIVHSDGLDFVMKAAASNMIGIAVYGLLLGDVASNRAFFKVFTLVLAALGASALITISLLPFVPLNELYVGNASIAAYTAEEGYFNYGDIYFPFTMNYGFYPVGGIEFPRTTGFFREPGILQAFFLWGVVYALNERLSRLVVVLLLLGVAASLSTAGVALLPATLLLWLALKARTTTMIKALMVLAGSAVTLAALVYTPAVGIVDKSAVHGDSIEGRLDVTSLGLKSMLENPLGIGMYGEPDVHNAGVNLLAATGQIGALGFVLVVLMFAVPILLSPGRGAYAVAIFPVFMTGLLSQPLINAPLVYVMLLAHFSSLVQANKKWWTIRTLPKANTGDREPETTRNA